MSEEMLTLSVDRGGSRLRALLEAQFAYEKARRSRRRWLVVSLVVLVVSWIAAHTVIAATAAGSALRAVVFLRTALAGAHEWQRQRRWRDALAQG